jgi:hypothetical protein
MVSLGPRLSLSRPVSRPVCGLGCGCLVRLRFALRSLAVWRVRAIAPSFVSGWRAFSSVLLCVKCIYGGLGLLCAPCVGLASLVRLRFALRGFALKRVCALAPGFISGWRAFFPFLSLCKVNLSVQIEETVAGVFALAEGGAFSWRACRGRVWS